jgi:hypothetical protein
MYGKICKNSHNVKLFGTVCDTFIIAMEAQKYCLTLWLHFHCLSQFAKHKAWQLRAKFDQKRRCSSSDIPISWMHYVANTLVLQPRRRQLRIIYICSETAKAPFKILIMIFSIHGRFCECYKILRWTLRRFMVRNESAKTPSTTLIIIILVHEKVCEYYNGLQWWVQINKVRTKSAKALLQNQWPN